MQSVVPDIFDNHSLAPNIKLRDNLDYGPLEGESNRSVAYTVPSYQQPGCDETRVKQADVICKKIVLRVQTKSVSDTNRERQRRICNDQNAKTVVGPYSYIIR